MNAGFDDNAGFDLGMEGEQFNVDMDFGGDGGMDLGGMVCDAPPALAVEYCWVYGAHLVPMWTLRPTSFGEPQDMDESAVGAGKDIALELHSPPRSHAAEEDSARTAEDEDLVNAPLPHLEATVMTQRKAPQRVRALPLDKKIAMTAYVYFGFYCRFGYSFFYFRKKRQNLTFFVHFYSYWMVPVHLFRAMTFEVLLLQRFVMLTLLHSCTYLYRDEIKVYLADTSDIMRPKTRVSKSRKQLVHQVRTARHGNLFVYVFQNYQGCFWPVPKGKIANTSCWISNLVVYP